MRQYQTRRALVICVISLAFLIGAYAVVAPTTSATAAVTTPDGAAQVATCDGEPSLPPGETGNELQSVGTIGRPPSTEIAVDSVASNPSPDPSLLADYGESRVCSTAEITAIDCPIDSQFNGTAPNWTAHASTWYIGGTYLYTTGTAGTLATASYIANFTNFEYQARLWRSGCETCANRILFRGDPTPLSADGNWNSYYSFQYARNGTYSIFKRTSGGASTALKNWTSSSAINQGDAWNVLRVVAEGSTLKFYINGTLVWSGIDSSLSYGRAGLGMYRDTDSTGNELRVDWAQLCTHPNEVFLPRVMRSP